MKRIMTLLLVVVGLQACGDDGLLTPNANQASENAGARLDVLTWNVYVGARLENLLLVQDPTQIPFEVANIVGQVVANDFGQRAEAIADQIADKRPHVISLQEVSLFRTQSPGDFLQGNPVSAQTPFLDYLGILQSALTSRGLRYDVAAVSDNFDIELPVVNFQTGGLDDVRLTDSDVILVRRGVQYQNAQDGNFAAALPLNVGGATVNKPSGWASIDVRRAGRSWRVVNTHLEAADIAPGVVDPLLAALQGAQLAELTGILDASPIPVILMGDLNSAADGSTTGTYTDLVAAGFADAWIFGADGPGYTSNQADHLMNTASQLFHRIDFIFGRGAGIESVGFPGRVVADRVGEAQEDRTTDGLWPSDHAGVFASLVLQPGP